MVLEQNYSLSVLLQLAAFPSVYADWGKYESCAVDEISLGPSDTTLGPLDSAKLPPPAGGWRAEQEVVRACGEMVESYGLSLLLREGDVIFEEDKLEERGDAGAVAGVATLRVKRLPQSCHLEEDEDGFPSVVCTVGVSDALEAPGLEAIAYVESIAVSQDWRGSGLANQFLDFLEAKAKTWNCSLMGLHVHRDNWPALRFYHKNGFEITSDWLGWGPSFWLLVKPVV